tara:strand:+ start:76 stop:357 length:282 start_codon:yes stop_codon:yes gene_type:complete
MSKNIIIEGLRLLFNRRVIPRRFKKSMRESGEENIASAIKNGDSKRNSMDRFLRLVGISNFLRRLWSKKPDKIVKIRGMNRDMVLGWIDRMRS